MNSTGVPVGGLKTVGQVVATNTLTFRAGQNGLAIAVELLSTHTAGAPVLDRDGKYVGFITEFDVMKALVEGFIGGAIAEQVITRLIFRNAIQIEAIRILYQKTPGLLGNQLGAFTPLYLLVSALTHCCIDGVIRVRRSNRGKTVSGGQSGVL